VNASAVTETLARVGTAGRTGEDVRSDLRVSVRPGGTAGIRIELRSKVAASYGEDIRTRATAVLQRLGVDSARVEIDDHGALPWVIEARVEAAARAAGVEPRIVPGPAGAATARPPSPHDRLRRSRLYLPGAEPKFMVNAGLHRPDCVILDLEDSVHPDAKDAARLLVRNALRAVDFGAAERMVRINQAPLGVRDLEEVVPAGPDLILIPKVEDPEQVREVAHRADAIRAASAEPGQPVWLMPIIESALGIERAFEIATAAPSVVALTIGLEDYTADLGVAKTRSGAESLWARSRIVNAARAAGVQAIDSVYGDVQDEAGLRAWGMAARGLGFSGMGCVHPRQIRILHEVFAPAADEIEKALRIVAAFREAEARGLGVVSLGSKMVDPPVVLRARRLVEAARALGLLTEGGP
jgi:citrate lyase subunit beta / citryl-CoA lyase